MNGLLYLIRKDLRNRLLRLLKKPLLLGMYLLFAAVLVFSLLSMNRTPAGLPSAPMDIGWLKLFFLGYMLLFAVSGITAGLSTGGSVFEMADVNLLFVSPVSAKKILVYGLARQAGRSVFAGVFILMMGGTLSRIWRITPPQMLYLFLGYVAGLVIFQLFSICIYMYVSRYPFLKGVVVAVCVAFLLPMLAAVLLPVLRGAPLAGSVLAVMNGNLLFTLPVAGWVTYGVFAPIAGNTAGAALALGLTLGFILLMVFLLLFGKTDYYEHVLVATETAFQRKRAVEEGNLEAANGARKVRLNKRASRRSGRIWGEGARAFLGKHMVENFRRNRLKVLDASSFSYIFTALFLSLAFKGQGSLLPVLVSLMSMRVLLVGTGLGLRELYSHYIFMVPAGSFAKIVWSNLETVVKSLAESLLAFGIAGAILRLPVPEILLGSLASVVFTAMLLAVNLLSMRIFRDVIGQGLLLTFYILFVVLVMVPGIMGAALSVLIWPGEAGVALALAVLTLWEALLCALFFFLARGVLHTQDMETMPKNIR